MNVFSLCSRLLGPAASQNLTTTPGQAMPVFGDSRVVLMDNGLGIFTQNEEEPIDFVVNHEMVDFPAWYISILRDPIIRPLFENPLVRPILLRSSYSFLLSFS